MQNALQPRAPILRQKFGHPCSTGTGEFYRHHWGELLDPGAERAAFDMPVGFTLPPQWLFGPSILAGSSPSPIQPPQVYAFNTNLLVGLGGNFAGQLFSQPLLVPDNE